MISAAARRMAMRRCKNLLGGKGANLAEMSKLGLPVPPGFTITTEVCTVFYKNKRKYPDDLDAQVNDALRALEGGRTRSSAMCVIRCWCLCARARARRCRA